MSSIKVIDINEEAKQETVQEPEQIEEATEQIEPTNEIVDNPPVEEVKEEVKETKADAKQVQCPKCSKYMSLKNFRYRHEKLCTTEPKPVKPQAKPKGKSKPKPIIKQVEVNEQPQEEQQSKPKPVIKQQIPQQQSQPSNPLMDITNHYQLLQNQFIQQKKENITIFVRICSPQNLKRDDYCETIIIFNLLIKNDII